MIEPGTPKEQLDVGLIKVSEFESDFLDEHPLLNFDKHRVDKIGHLNIRDLARAFCLLHVEKAINFKTLLPQLLKCTTLSMLAELYLSVVESLPTKVIKKLHTTCVQVNDVLLDMKYASLSIFKGSKENDLKPVDKAILQLLKAGIYSDKQVVDIICEQFKGDEKVTPTVIKNKLKALESGRSKQYPAGLRPKKTAFGVWVVEGENLKKQEKQSILELFEGEFLTLKSITSYSKLATEALKCIKETRSQLQEGGK